MEVVVLIPAVFVFLYSLYRLVKDDYVFIRKGISLEQSFDIAFITLWISLFFSRLFDMLFSLNLQKNVFFQFFSLKDGGFSLIGAIIGGIIALYIIGKIKRIPLGRISDFFTLSLLFALPVGYLGNAILVQRSQLLYTLLNVILFFLLMVFFVQFLKPKLMSRALKEGTISILFLIFFSILTLLSTLVASLKDIHGYMLNPNTIATICLLIFSIIFYFKEERPFARTRKSLYK